MALPPFCELLTVRYAWLQTEPRRRVGIARNQTTSSFQARGRLACQYPVSMAAKMAALRGRTHMKPAVAPAREKCGGTDVLTLSVLHQSPGASPRNHGQ